MAQQWEYKVTFVVNLVSKIPVQMAEMAEQGWELVNGAVATYVVGGGVTTEYAMWWRRPA